MNGLPSYWQFYASMTNEASSVRGLLRRYYQGWAEAGQEAPHHPLERVIFTPLFTQSRARELFRSLARGTHDLPFFLPRPTYMFDSGGYQVQMGRMSYEDLCTQLRVLYEQETWADWYVLPDHVPLSSDPDDVARRKAEETLAVGSLFLQWFPERRDRFIGAVIGRTAGDLERCAHAWHSMGVRYLAFGSFGTSGPSGSVNMMSSRSVRLLAALAQVAQENGQKIHVFGIGSPQWVSRLHTNGVYAHSFDSSNWWKMAGYGYVFAGGRTHRICPTRRQSSTVEIVEESNKHTGHYCPFCQDARHLRDNRWARVLHNLCFFLEVTANGSIFS